MLNELFDEEGVTIVEPIPVTGVKLSELRNLTEAHKLFLWEYVKKNGDGSDVKSKLINCQNRIDKINEKNAIEDPVTGKTGGAFRRFMMADGNKYHQQDWWLAQAIRMDEFGLERIDSGRFTSANLKKLQANSTQKITTKSGKDKKVFNNIIKDEWIKLVIECEVDPYLYDRAAEEGIIFDI